MMDTQDITVSDVETSETVNELFGALAKAQGEIRNAAKDSANPHFKSSYADLASIADACRAQLSKNGLAVVQIPHNQGDDVAVTTILGHASGQWIKGRIAVKPLKFDAQGAGSVITYLRRYALAAMAGVAPGDDDDGEAAMGRGRTNGNGQADISAPARAVKVAAPKTNGNGEVWKADAERIKAAIKKAGNPIELDDLLAAESDALKSIKEHSQSAYEFLIMGVNGRKSDMRETDPAAYP